MFLVFDIGGEKWGGTHFARGCQIFLKPALRNIDNLNSLCKRPAVEVIIS